MDERVVILCVDHRLDDDLLFWQSFIREVSGARLHEPMFLVLGSSDRCALMVEAAGGTSTRTDGVLRLESSAEREAFERALRDDGRRIVQLFSDSGVSSVSFAGFDRGILICDDSDGLAVSRVGSMTAWCRSGVIPVLMSSARNLRGEILDVHPATVCKLIVDWMKRNGTNLVGDMVLLLYRLSDDLAEKIDSRAELKLRELVEAEALPDPSYVPFIEEFRFEIGVSHVSRLAEMKTARLAGGRD